MEVFAEKGKLQHQGKSIPIAPFGRRSTWVSPNDMFQQKHFRIRFAFSDAREARIVKIDTNSENCYQKLKKNLNEDPQKINFPRLFSKIENSFSIFSKILGNIDYLFLHQKQIIFEKTRAH